MRVNSLKVSFWFFWVSWLFSLFVVLGFLGEGDLTVYVAEF